ncbi:Uncharacterised protein [Burkholderia pseudomallei]|nr:Uncharacterised protein [Burkholderia pseudomallei]CAJ9780796.1 Uncharacterised protein [Burkholderia pseudomallei]
MRAISPSGATADSAYRYAASPSDSTAIVRATMPSPPVTPTCRCSGRMPTVTRSPARSVDASTAARCVSPDSKRTSAPSADADSTTPARKFIFGEPMKPATNWFAGA